MVVSFRSTVKSGSFSLCVQCFLPGKRTASWVTSHSAPGGGIEPRHPGGTGTETAVCASGLKTERPKYGKLNENPDSRELPVKCPSLSVTSDRQLITDHLAGDDDSR